MTKAQMDEYRRTHGGLKQESAEDIAADVDRGAPDPNKRAMDEIARKRAEKEAKDDKTKGRPKSRVGVKTVEEEQTDAKARRCRDAGRRGCDGLVLLMTSLMGQEWWYLKPQVIAPGPPPITYDERSTMQEAWADTFEYYGWEKFPPWMGFLIVTGTYASVRLAMPETQSKMQMLKERFAAGFARRMVRPGPPPPQTGEKRGLFRGLFELFFGRKG